MITEVIVIGLRLSFGTPGKLFILRLIRGASQIPLTSLAVFAVLELLSTVKEFTETAVPTI